MGEARRKSRNREQILAGEPRCIYCEGPPETIEHMPPRSMFRDRFRLSGMEYACCKQCNDGTRAADAIASVLAFIGRPGSDPFWQTKEMKRALSAAEQLAPGFRAEILGSSYQPPEWWRTPSGLYRQAFRANGDGPILAKHLDMFSAKLAMALYREQVGCALPITGSTFGRWFLNSGLDQPSLDAMLTIMPGHECLKMGRQASNEQFSYRYYTDKSAFVAAVVGFHTNLHFLVIATSEADKYRPIFVRSPRVPDSGRPWLREVRPGTFGECPASAEQRA